MLARYTYTSMPYFWKLKWKEFMVYYGEIAKLAAEESGGAENPADQSTWQNIMPPPMSGPPPTEKDFIAND